MKYNKEYVCKDNYCFIGAVEVNGELDEIHVGMDKSTGKVVVSIEDLSEALEFFGYILIRVDEYKARGEKI